MTRSSLLHSSGFILVVLAFLPVLVVSKFTHTYRGIARDGLNACLADSAYNFTHVTITYRANAGAGFKCIMANIDNDRQTILSAGASILGLIPTAITLLGNRRSDINLIHEAFPLLAFFLSLTGVSVESRIVWRNISAHKQSAIKSAIVQHSKWPLNLLWRNSYSVDSSTKCGVLVVYILALIASTAVVWQSYDLSQRAVVSWSCWTSFLPMIWFILGPLIHICEVAVLQIDHSLHTYWIRVLTVALDTFNKVQFLAGTAILGSLALVSGQNAVKVLAIYGGAAIVMRECATWVLDIL